MIILKKILKTFSFFAVAIVLLPIITFLINPRHIIDFSDNPVDQKLYVDISFGPIETYFPLFKIGSITDHPYSYKFYRWSPDGNHFAYIADMSESERTEEKDFMIVILNPRTFQRKIVLIGDKGRYGWVDNDTIRYFRGMGTGVGTYKDININAKEPVIVIDDLKGGSSRGWHPTTLDKMYEIEEELAQLSK